MMNGSNTVFWAISTEDVLLGLQTTKEGLTQKEALKRLARFGPNELKAKKRSGDFFLFFSQFKSPIVLILIFAAGLSFFLHDPADALIILAIVLISGALGFWQERKASSAVEKLLSIVQTNVTVLRGKTESKVAFEQIVPGDVLVLSAGNAIPGDALLIEAKDLFVNEAALTGETYPAAKMVGTLPKETPLSQRANTLFMGTHVISGEAKAVVVHTGRNTEFGKVAERLKLRPPETEFERGIRRFGYFLLELTLMMVIAIFALNVLLKRPVLDSFLFSLALAVGLTPQLRPAIISINLSHGASRMAQEKVIVKRLNAIENFGSMNVLCSDKTGTLTEGVVRVQSALDTLSQESEKVMFYAYLNAFYETGFFNPVDESIRTRMRPELPDYQKLDEIPYDFVRKRLSILVSRHDKHFMVTKGAMQNVLAVCSQAEMPGGKMCEMVEVEESLREAYKAFSAKGFRTLGIAYKDVGTGTTINKEQESGMTFLGFLVLSDPPKADVIETMGQLKSLGVSLKLITGDNALVASNISQQVGLSNQQILTGAQLRQMSDEALMHQASDVDVFAEVEPNQKEPIIAALKKSGNVVGCMGDGINDASALHAADVGISVDSAVDVAKNAADIVLLEKELTVLAKGIREGRNTFANTLKYVFMATSANFGNMFSMAGASRFLPFLPLLPKQILLTNLMTDFPEMTISTDSVDPEMIEKPRRWNIRSIRKFMTVFGTLSSMFDFITFGVLLLILHATTEQFRTGWFIESVISASMIVLVIRSRRPFFKSRPSRYLLIVTFAVIVVAILLPFTPLGQLLGFIPLPIPILVLVGLIVALYILGAEAVKRAFFKRVKL